VHDRGCQDTADRGNHGGVRQRSEQGRRTVRLGKEGDLTGGLGKRERGRERSLPGAPYGTRVGLG
jgi:hypothetical protein